MQKRAAITFLQLCYAALCRIMSLERCSWLATCVSEEASVSLHPPLLAAGGWEFANDHNGDEMVGKITF